MTAPSCLYVAGVDGGGTRCRVRLRTIEGKELAFAEGGSANVHADPAGALETIVDTLNHAFYSAGLGVDQQKSTALGLGLAGIVSLADGEAIRTSFQGFGHVVAESDAAAACLGAHNGADGGLVIAGTGSAGFARMNGTMTGLGGRGFAISDEGSAARIGWEALRQSIQAADGLIASTKMTAHMMKKFDSDPIAVTRWAKTARPSDYGALAPMVFDHATKGDAIALPIIKQAAHAILALRAALLRLGITRVALVGGLAEPLRPWLALEHHDSADLPLFVPAIRDAADGAILMAGGKMP